MYAKNIRPSAKRKIQTEPSAMLESRTLGALKFTIEARDENLLPPVGRFFLKVTYCFENY